MKLDETPIEGKDEDPSEPENENYDLADLMVEH
jgi:hypothetical protein